MQSRPQIFDISPVVSVRSAPFPGDTRYSLEWLCRHSPESRYSLSKLTMSPHLGAHADAPSHYHPEGIATHQRDPDRYLGPCQVIHARGLKPGQRIRVEHLGGRPIEAPRILVRTLSFPDPNRWNDDFNSFDPSTISYFVEKGVRLLGIDTPSVDPSTSKELESHQAIYAADLAILEGLDLAQVDEGQYWLSALPLRLEGAEASPVRAILIRGNPGDLK